MKKSILIGKIGNSKVQLDVELKTKTNPSITTFLTPIPSNGFKQLSISGSIGKRSCGQIHDSINPYEFNELYVDREWLIKLLAIWKVCHLNDLNAGTELQMEYVDFWKNQMGNRYDYTKACQMLKQHHLLIDNETNPQLNVGYEYGTSWLVRLLPDSIEQFFQSIPITSPDQLRSPILDYLLEHNYKWKIQLVDENPYMEAPNMDHWKIIFYNDNKKQFTTYFSTGIGHRLYPNESGSNLHLIAMKWAKNTIKMLNQKPEIYKWRSQINQLGLYIESVPLASFRDQSIYEGIRKSPMPDEVIDCILEDYLTIEGYNSWDDWACDLGFDLEFKQERLKAKKAYNTIISQSDKAQRFFLSDWSQLIDLAY